MRLTRKTLIGMGLVTAVVALTLLSGSPVLAAQPDKDVIVVNTPAQPVPVTGTVKVTGTSAVEVVNDALNEPYIKLASVSLSDGTLLGQVTFDIPDGKRLVIETVSVQAAVPSGQKVRVFLDVTEGIGSLLGVLPVQSPGPILGVEYFVANLPFKLRKDAIPGAHRRDRRPNGSRLVGRRRHTACDDLRLSGRSLIDAGCLKPCGWRKPGEIKEGMQMKTEKVSNLMFPNRPAARGMKFVVSLGLATAMILTLSTASWATLFDRGGG